MLTFNKLVPYAKDKYTAKMCKDDYSPYQDIFIMKDVAYNNDKTITFTKKSDGELTYMERATINAYKNPNSTHNVLRKIYRDMGM